MASKEDKLEVEGTVIELLPNTQFMVELDNGHKVLSYLSCLLYTSDAADE